MRKSQPNKNLRANSHIKLGRMVARSFGIRKCHRKDAEEIFEWIDRLKSNDIQSLATRHDPQDALNNCVR